MQLRLAQQFSAAASGSQPNQQPAKKTETDDDESENGEETNDDDDNDNLERPDYWWTQLQSRLPGKNVVIFGSAFECLLSTPRKSDQKILIGQDACITVEQKHFWRRTGRQIESANVPGQCMDVDHLEPDVKGGQVREPVMWMVFANFQCSTGITAAM